MNEDMLAGKNIDLMNDFMRFAFERPEILDSIPGDAQLVLLPTNDTELYKENMKTLERLKKDKKRHIVFKIEPVMPKVELMESFDQDETIVE